MAYIKLNEVEIINSPTDFKILIEDDNEIKRMPAENLVVPQVRADWNETDATKSSFILNKPESLGGGGKVVVYTGSSGMYTDSDGNSVSAKMAVDEWNAGSILRIAYAGAESNVVSIKPSYSYDSMTGNNDLTSARFWYLYNGSVSSDTFF